VRILLLLLMLSRLAAAQNAATPAPLGKLIDVGGYRVHLYCTGAGSPTVFIAGGLSIDWSLVQPDIAKVTQVCTYDVSGTAWSDAGPASTCKDRVSEIHRLLDHAGIKRPFIFVGHSIGALVGREYDAEYPEEIAGMVMVDHAFLPARNTSAKPTGGLLNIRPDANGDHPPVLLYQVPIDLGTEDTADFKNLPENMQALHRWAAARRPVLATGETAEDCVSQLTNRTQNPHAFGERPLVVISTGNDSAGYAELQIKLLALSTNSKQLAAEKSFHSVEIDEPEVVIRGVREVIESVRGRRKLVAASTSFTSPPMARRAPTKNPMISIQSCRASSQIRAIPATKDSVPHKS
jgi:pimeloyl-ACP methyl ester carboxylesterase